MPKFIIQNLKFIIFVLLIASKSYGQTQIDSVLVNISKNNKTIAANTKYWEAKKLEFKTGLTPNNPKVDYDFLIGTPSDAGNQTEFAVTQSFDFPTVYTKKKTLSDEQIKKAEFQLVAIRQDILLEAKLVCNELIYRNKLNAELSFRQQNTQKWLSFFQIGLEKGGVTIMDVNKAKLQIVEINAELSKNRSKSNQLNQKLTELNGGIPIQFSDTSYASFLSISNLETLEKEIEIRDPVRKYLEQEKTIGQNEVSLSKSLSLPKVETGYRYQTILGQQFNGVHLGLTIPLWENKNTVKTKRAELILNEANLQDHITKHQYDVKQKFERMSNLKLTLAEYQNLFSSFNNVELLDKSLTMGQISTIEYFMELTIYYEALENFLKMEMEYNNVIVELYKFEL